MRIVILIIVIFIALLIRFSIAVSDIPLMGDSKTRYHPIATNLLAGHGFTREFATPYHPDSFDQPGYPLFLASVYAVTNSSRRAVVLAQLFLELLILLTVVWIARAFSLSRQAQVVAVVTGLICPFLAKYAGLVLSEVLATLIITLACYAFIRAVDNSSKKKPIWWALAGLTSGASLLVRADTVIVVALMFVVALILARPASLARRGQQVSIFLISLTVTLTPWTVRNYIHFRSFLPLGSVAQQSGFPYVKWLNTWLDSPDYIKPYWWEAMKGDDEPPPFPVAKIPDEDERHRAWNALLLARKQKTMAGEPTEEYRALAAEALRKRPLQILIAVPVRRLIKTWLYPQINQVPTVLHTRLPFFSIYGLWLVLSGCALLGLVHALRLRLYGVLLLAAVIVGRMILPLISSLGADPRLLVEAIPASYVLACFLSEVYRNALEVGPTIRSFLPPRARSRRLLNDARE